LSATSRSSRPVSRSVLRVLCDLCVLSVKSHVAFFLAVPPYRYVASTYLLYLPLLRKHRGVYQLFPPWNTSALTLESALTKKGGGVGVLLLTRHPSKDVFPDGLSGAEGTLFSLPHYILTSFLLNDRATSQPYRAPASPFAEASPSSHHRPRRNIQPLCPSRHRGEFFRSDFRTSRKSSAYRRR
jgi:hypothetical protein